VARRVAGNVFRAGVDIQEIRFYALQLCKLPLPCEWWAEVQKRDLCCGMTETCVCGPEQARPAACAWALVWAKRHPVPPATEAPAVTRSLRAGGGALSATCPCALACACTYDACAGCVRVRKRTGARVF
jgi:hypothetical protein